METDKDIFLSFKFLEWQPYRGYVLRDHEVYISEALPQLLLEVNPDNEIMIIASSQFYSSKDELIDYILKLPNSDDCLFHISILQKYISLQSDHYILNPDDDFGDDYKNWYIENADQAFWWNDL